MTDKRRAFDCIKERTGTGRILNSEYNNGIDAALTHFTQLLDSEEMREEIRKAILKEMAINATTHSYMYVADAALTAIKEKVELWNQRK